MKVGIANNQSFTSVIPVKVFIDGRQTVDDKTVEQCFNKFRKIVTTIPKNTDDSRILNRYIMHDKDITAVKILDGEQTPDNATMQIRSAYGKDYIFTGYEAAYMSVLSADIGQAKRKSYHKAGHTKTHEVYNANAEFVDKIKEFADDKSAYLKKGGKFLGLHINMKSNGKKLEVNDIKFCRIG